MNFSIYTTTPQVKFGNSDCNNDFFNLDLTRPGIFIQIMAFSSVALGAMLLCICCCCYCCYKTGEKVADRRLAQAARDFDHNQISQSPVVMGTPHPMENTVNMANEEINRRQRATHVTAVPNSLRNVNDQTIQRAETMTYHAHGHNSPGNARLETEGQLTDWGSVERTGHPPPAYSELSCAQRRRIPSAPYATYRSSVSGRFHPPPYDNVMCDPETFHLHISYVNTTCYPETFKLNHLNLHMII
ncbi:hypothetical protein DPMN_194847 [Dreissena polymorpha]|uniref:Uncharacterized protein n=1 Tax=Dreissena polymorpha TaxID=45954 RepID=A0A9D3Y1W1_DREPO|nr:hypothetical protein DPMN_194847 [Dreissena polymorpha]